MFYETIKLANKIKSKVAKYNAVLYSTKLKLILNSKTSKHFPSYQFASYPCQPISSISQNHIVFPWNWVWHCKISNSS